jgi:hypothetical protein
MAIWSGVVLITVRTFTQSLLGIRYCCMRVRLSLVSRGMRSFGGRSWSLRSFLSCNSPFAV